DRRGARRLAEQSRADPNVLPRAFEPWPDPDAARLLARERDVAQRAPARSGRVVRTQAGLLAARLPLGPVELPILAQIGPEARPARERAEAAQQSPHGDVTRSRGPAGWRRRGAGTPRARR